MTIMVKDHFFVFIIIMARQTDTAPLELSSLGCSNKNTMSFNMDDMSDPVNVQKSNMYLQCYRYMGPSHPMAQMQDMKNPSVVFKAIADFQTFAGLTVTGTLTSETLKKMDMPRCGVPDPMGAPNTRRKKRYVLQGSRWDGNDLSYRIIQRTPDVDAAMVDDEIQEAFKLWKDASQLTFTQVTNANEDVDIVLSFQNYGSHGDNYPFDGKGGTLAHAFFPEFGGDVHFDDDEEYTVGPINPVSDLRQIAAHEIGHSLGLSHTDEQDALMAPFYAGYKANLQLHNDDVLAIQTLYGVGMEEEEPAPDPDPDEPPDEPEATPPPGPECADARFDAVANTHDNRTFGFRGDKYYQLTASGVVKSGLIREGWTNANGESLPDNLDAGFYWPNSVYEYWTFNWQTFQWEKKIFNSFGDTFFFKDDRVYITNNMTFSHSEPISKLFPGIPSPIDSAFIWPLNNRLYLTLGSQYYRIRSQYRRSSQPYASLYKDFGYPQPLSVWLSNSHLQEDERPDHFDAVLTLDGKTHFFVDNKYYYFQDHGFKIAEGYPKMISDNWLKCDPHDDEMELGRPPMEEEYILVPTVKNKKASAAVKIRPSTNIIIIQMFAMTCVWMLIWKFD